MTICIAGIADNNKIVAITDKMLTITSAPITKYEISENNKAIKLSEKVLGLFAGDVVIANEILSFAKTKIKTEGTVREIADKVNDAYIEYHKAVLDNYLVKKYTLTLQDFMQSQGTLDTELVKQVTKVIMDYNIDVEIIVAGIDSAPHIYMINNFGTVISRDSIGYACVGSGSPHATLSLIESSYNSGMKLSKAVYAMIQAKKRAEFDPGVGVLWDFVLINEKFKILSNAEVVKVVKLFEKSQSIVAKTVELYSEKVLKEI